MLCIGHNVLLSALFLNFSHQTSQMKKTILLQISYSGDLAAKAVMGVVSWAWLCLTEKRVMMKQKRKGSWLGT